MTSRDDLLENFAPRCFAREYTLRLNTSRTRAYLFMHGKIFKWLLLGGLSDFSWDITLRFEENYLLFQGKENNYYLK